MKKIVENTAFDQIYHEHLLYYNLKTLQFLLNKYNFEIFDAHAYKSSWRADGSLYQQQRCKKKN